MTRFNYRFLSDLIVISLILTGLTIYAHRYQVGRSAPLILRLAREARDAGREGQAAQLYMRYLKLEPESADAIGEFGEMAAQSGNVEGTYYQLEKSLRLNPDQSALRHQLGAVAVKLERYADAKRILLSETSRDFRNRPRHQWLLGVAEEHLGQFDAAREYFETAVEAAPEEPDYVESLANLLSDQFSEDEQSKQILDRLVDAVPENARVYLIRGRWSCQRGLEIADPKLAEPVLAAAWDDMQQGYQLAPKNPKLAILAADIATAQGKPGQAREMVTKAISENTSRPDLYHVIAQIESAANNQDRAIQWLEDGLVESPENGQLLWDLAQLQFDAGNTEPLEDIFKQLRSQNYAEVPVRLLEARLMVAAGEFHEAADLLEESSLMFDGDQELSKQADDLLATCYLKLGDSDQQLAALRRLVVLDPQFMPAREATAKILLERGRLREAMAEYESILARPNPSVEARVNYARALFLEGLTQSGDNWHWNQLPEVLSTLESIPAAATDAAVLKARLLAAQGQTKEAMALLASQLDHDTESLAATRSLVAMLSENQDWERLEAVLQTVEQASGDSPSLRLEKARYLIERFGKEATAQPQLSQLAEPLPDWDPVQRAEMAMRLAELHLEIDDYPACEKLAREVLESETFQPRLDDYFLWFDLALRSGNTESMDAALARVEQFERADPLLQIGKGVRLMIEAQDLPDSNESERSSLFEQALTELTEASVARPTWSRIPHLRGDINDRWGRPELALPFYMDAINLGEQDYPMISRAAELLYEEERYAEADETIGRLRKQRRTLSNELMRTATHVAYHLDEIDRARRLAQECAEQSGEAQDHLLLAEICFRDGDLAAAQRESRAAVEIDPATSEGWVSLVHVLTEQQDLDRARQVIDEARQALPPEVLDDAIAQCYDAIKDYPQAEKHYAEALEATPDNRQLIRHAAEFYLKIKEPTKAEPLLVDLIRQPSESTEETSDDDRVWARRNLAWIYALRADSESLRRAAKLIDANKEQDVNGLEDDRVRVMIYWNRRDDESRTQAISLLKQLIREQSDFSLGDHFLLARYYYLTDDTRNYRRLMRTVLTNGGEQNANCVQYHAEALVEMGELEEAKTWIRQLNSLAPKAKATYAVVFEWLFRSKAYPRLLTMLEGITKDKNQWSWTAELAQKFGTTLKQRGSASEAQPFLALASKLNDQIAESEPKAESESKQE